MRSALQRQETSKLVNFLYEDNKKLKQISILLYRVNTFIALYLTLEFASKTYSYRVAFKNTKEEGLIT